MVCLQRPVVCLHGDTATDLEGGGVDGRGALELLGEGGQRVGRYPQQHQVPPVPAKTQTQRNESATHQKNGT